MGFPTRITLVLASAVLLVMVAGCGGETAASQLDGGTTVASGDEDTTPDLSSEGLPPAVAETRQKIYDAAHEFDYETLASLLDPETFNYSLGEEGDPIGYWQRQEEAEIPVLGDFLPTVLSTRHGKVDDIYVWPSATSKPVSEWTEEDVQSIRDAGYTDADIKAFKEQIGDYAGWRVGIRADGTWLYFISGD